MLLLHSGRADVEVAVVAVVRVLVLVVVQVLMMKMKALLRLLPLQPRRRTRMDLVSSKAAPDLAPNRTGLHRGRDYPDQTSGPSGGSLCI